MVTRRCSQRQCLLHPDRESVNAFIYCLAAAAQRHQIDLLDIIQLSNHLHDAIYDRHGNAPAFYQDFHRLLACCINVLRGRSENVFATTQPNVVILATTEDLIRRLVYVATNAVKHDLVARVDDWPGASGYRALLENKPLRATRPKHFFSADGDMPEEVTLWVGIPPELGDREEILSEVKRRVEEFEREKAAERARTGTRVLGRAAVLRQHWTFIPTTTSPRRPQRRIASACRLTLEKLLDQWRDFLDAHGKARLALLEGHPIPFPFGTYWLRRYVGVPAQQPNFSS